MNSNAVSPTRRCTLKIRDRCSAFEGRSVFAIASFCFFTGIANLSAAEVGHTSLFNLSLGELLEVRIVSAVSGFEQYLEEAPASVTVVTAEEWQAMGASTLTEAVSRVPGLHVGLTQVGLFYEKVMLRGLSGSFGQQVLLLVDGIPFRSPRAGGVPWAQHFPLNSFKRIEIIRGSGSAIYGADAVGGIINLVSYKPGEISESVSVGYGEHDTTLVKASKALDFGEHKFNLSWFSQAADDDDTRTVQQDLQVILDGFMETSASLSPGTLGTAYEVHSLRASWEYGPLELSYLDWYAPEYGDGPGLAQTLDPEGEAKMRTQFFNTDYDLSSHVKGNMDVRFAWHKFSFRTKATLFPPGVILFLDNEGNIRVPDSSSANLQRVTFPDGLKGSPGSDNHVISLQLNHIFDLSAKHKIRWAVGLDHSDNKAVEEKNFGPGVYDGSLVVDGTVTSVTGTEYVYLPDAERDNQFLALQDQWSISDKWVATLGVRYDNYSDFGSTTNPRLGIVWNATEKVSVKAYAGDAFRAPSFVDLYSQNNPAGVGNKDLTPEKIEMYDLGFSVSDFLVENLQIETSVFQYCADDLILYVPADRALMTQNSGMLKVRGIEQSVKWHSGEFLSMEWNASILSPYEEKSVDLSTVPQVLSNLIVHLHGEQFHWFLGGKWVGKRERSTGLRNDIEDYFIVDSQIEYGFDKWSIDLKINNIFDEDSREPSDGSIPDDYRLGGRRFLVQLTHHF